MQECYQHGVAGPPSLIIFLRGTSTLGSPLQVEETPYFELQWFIAGHLLGLRRNTLHMQRNELLSIKMLSVRGPRNAGIRLGF